MYINNTTVFSVVPDLRLAQGRKSFDLSRALQYCSSGQMSEENVQ